MGAAVPDFAGACDGVLRVRYHVANAAVPSLQLTAANSARTTMAWRFMRRPGAAWRNIYFFLLYFSAGLVAPDPIHRSRA